MKHIFTKNDVYLSTVFLKPIDIKGFRPFIFDSPYGRARFDHLQRCHGFAVLEYSFTRERHANGRIELVKYPG